MKCFNINFVINCDSLTYGIIYYLCIDYHHKQINKSDKQINKSDKQINKSDKQINKTHKQINKKSQANMNFSTVFFLL